MPINVNFLRERVQTLAKKDQKGYSTKAEFNGDLQSAQNLLFGYYWRIYEDTQNVVDALAPFVKEQAISLTNGYGNFPTDYHHRLELWYNHVLNTGCSTAPEITIIPVDYLLANEKAYTLSSPIRKPNLKKKILRHEFVDGKLKVYPTEVKSVTMKYLSKPPQAVWETTLVSTATEDFEQYDPSNSVNLIWNESETENFVAILLFLLGIQVKDNAIISYVKLKQQEELVK